MRVSTSWMYSSGATTLSQKQAELLRTQQQLSTGKRVLQPSDDPIAAAAALTSQQSLALSSQFTRNQEFAKSTLAMAESSLGQVGDVMQEARELAVSAGNGALNASDRRSLAQQLRGQIDTLLSLSNVRDGAGGYLFAGYQETAPPFAQTPGGIAYQGDQGSRALQVGAQRLLEISASGASVFESAFAGNGRFTISAAAANAGGASADAGSVTNPAALTGSSYQVLMHVIGGVTTYDVIDTTNSATLVAGAAYTSGMTISFDGMQVTLNGAPADNDAFDFAPSSRQSLFTTLENLAATLEASAAGTMNEARFRSALSGSLASIDQAADQVRATRTGIGVRLRELDSLGAQTADQTLHYQQELSRLTDLDFAQAISSLTMQQTTLQAAQQSYLRVTGLSLFNYL